MHIIIQIKHRHTDAVLFTHETTEERQASGLAMRDALEAATKARANLAGANLAGANLDGAHLAGAYLARANLDGANLAGANLAGANLDGAYLARAYLAGAYLAGAYLARANLDGANLAGANLAGANLDGAYLARANLDGAYLARANLDGANLDGGFRLVGSSPVLQIGPLGSRSAYLVAYRTDAGLRIRTGCFVGTRDAFAADVAKTHGDNVNVHGKNYAAALAFIDRWAANTAPNRGQEETR
jgi:uncharacterized protein YjbI with pentapeptide repeats